jgi:calcineurin-like phosphoesterase family protein
MFRHQGLRNMISLSLLMLLAMGSLWAQAETAQGVVFEDLDGDGLQGPAEPGIEGVAVSNQIDVVLTDAEGRYELSIEGDAVIFVTKPAGYAVPLSENNLPQFFYVHRPMGSPDTTYPGVAPTGALPERIDFPLERIDEPEQFRIVAMADPQPENGQEIDYLRRDVYSDLADLDVHHGVVLGDIMYDDLDLFGSHIAAIGRTGIPFYHIQGNHDMNYDAPPDEVSDDQSNETFVRHFGPDSCSWNVGRVHFVALDSIIKGEENDYEEGFGERQLTWLRNDLAHVPSDHLVVLCTHSPIRFLTSRRPDNPLVVNAGALFEILEGHERILSLSGHTHYNFHHRFGPEDGWTGEGRFDQLNCVTACGAWWSGPTDVRGIPVTDQRDGSPNGFTVIEFDGAEYRTEFRAAGLGREHQMRIYPPGDHSAGESPRTTVLVNVFHGGPESTVECSLDGGEFLPMVRRPQTDPVAELYYAGPAESGKTWIDPTQSDHIWELDFGDSLPRRGTHRITVRVTEPDGDVFTSSRIY